jgi:catechol 2,3-dioxygenase-like lactoylglutathione lyase family enzyme
MSSGIVRPHVALAVTDLEASIAFYRALFESEPAKVKEGYAKFDLQRPGLNLSLNQTDRSAGTPTPMHFGIELDSTDAVAEAKERVAAAGLRIDRIEDQVTCCYAVQDKFWLVDPDGHEWELFTVLSDADSYGPVPTAATPKKCCG